MNKSKIKKLIKESFEKLLQETKYYNSHGNIMSMSEFIEIEVEDRSNYSKEEIEEWINKYNIKEDDKVIWVTPKKWVANRYNLSSEDWYKAEKVPEEQMNVFEFDDNQGFIIPESDDGDDGYLFVFYKKDLLKESRMVTHTFQIASDIKRNVPGIEKLIELKSTGNGTVGLFRYRDGNAYEIVIRPVEYGEFKDYWGKLITKSKQKEEPSPKSGFITKKLASSGTFVNENTKKIDINDIEQWLIGECIPFAVALNEIFPEYKIAVMNDEFEDVDEDAEYNFNFVHAFCYHPKNHEIIIDALGVRKLSDLYDDYHDINPIIDWDIPNAQYLIDNYSGKMFASEESYDYDINEYKDAKTFIKNNINNFKVENNNFINENFNFLFKEKTYKEKVFDDLYNNLMNKYKISEKAFKTLDELSEILDKFKNDDEITQFIKEKEEEKKAIRLVSALIEDKYEKKLDDKIKEII